MFLAMHGEIYSSSDGDVSFRKNRYAIPEQTSCRNFKCALVGKLRSQKFMNCHIPSIRFDNEKSVMKIHVIMFGPKYSTFKS